jgi:hypothetical protein
VNENDSAGNQFVKGIVNVLQSLEWDGVAYELSFSSLDGVKDINDLFCYHD